MVASHRGLFSLGLVLTVGVTGAMLTSLILLPSLLALLTPSSKQPQAAETAEVPEERPSTLPLKPRELPAA